MTLCYPWQQSEWQRLCEQLEHDKLPHALFLTGPEGIGKRQFASAFARLLLCDAPQQRVPCGACRGCLLNAAGTHPDFVSVMPEDGSKVIKIQQIRELTDFVANTAQQGGRKLVLIAPAEAMNANAANALLKSLEEPAGRTVLLLVSHSPSYVMPTIRSRCQQIRFPVPPLAQSLAWLANLTAGTDPAPLLQQCGGAPLAALALLGSDRLEQRQKLHNDLLALRAQQLSAVDAAQRWNTLEPLDVVEWLVLYLHESQRSAGADRCPGIVAELAQVPAQRVFRLYDKLLRQKKQLLSGANPNKQLVLEELALDWVALFTGLHPPRQAPQNPLTYRI
jgi:DNA polymerase-3 subunit delta'